MIIQIYTIHDKVAEAYQRPFFARTHAEAVRMLRQAIADPQSDFHRTPDDYSLYCDGSFDDQTGSITCLDPPLLVVHLGSLKEPT